MSTVVSVAVVSSERLRIKIYGFLHLSLAIDQLVAIQSWQYGNSRFVIEYTCHSTRIETVYDRRDLWEAILVGLEQISLI